MVLLLRNKNLQHSQFQNGFQFCFAKRNRFFRFFLGGFWPPGSAPICLVLAGCAPPGGGSYFGGGYCIEVDVIDSQGSVW